ncbi:MAG: hypothetical protein AB8H86_06760 [Polyangiales bacterium]
MTWLIRSAWMLAVVAFSSLPVQAQDSAAPAPVDGEVRVEAPPTEEVVVEDPTQSVSDSVVEAVADAVSADAVSADAVSADAEGSVSGDGALVEAAPLEPVVEEPATAPAPDAQALDTVESPQPSVERDRDTLDRSNEWRPWFAVLTHISLLSDRLAVSTLNIRFGYGINAGARRGPWGVYGHIEQNLYAETEFDFVARAGTLNIAVGGERFFFRERLRMAAAVGVSVLLTELALHSTGHTGLFVQIKPAGIRFARQSQVVIQLDLASITVAAPVLGSPSVVDLQYRTTLGIEWQGQH